MIWKGCFAMTRPANDPIPNLPQREETSEERRQVMSDLAPNDGYGVLTEPTTLTIQRFLPGPIERVWAFLTESTCAANGWHPAR
jgi:hypothetical protein